MTKTVHILKDNIKDEIIASGIISSDSILQLTLSLNRTFNFDLKLTTPIINLNSDIEFPVCVYRNENDQICYLIKNKQNGRSLFSAYQIVDFIMVFKGEQASDLLQKLTPKLNNLESVSAIIPIEIKKLKRLQALIQI